jgi:hypothetical protein
MHVLCFTAEVFDYFLCISVDPDFDRAHRKLISVVDADVVCVCGLTVEVKGNSILLY